MNATRKNMNNISLIDIHRRYKFYLAQKANNLYQVMFHKNDNGNNISMNFKSSCQRNLA